MKLELAKKYNSFFPSFIFLPGQTRTQLFTFPQSLPPLRERRRLRLQQRESPETASRWIILGEQRRRLPPTGLSLQPIRIYFKHSTTDLKLLEYFLVQRRRRRPRRRNERGKQLHGQERRGESGLRRCAHQSTQNGKKKRQKSSGFTRISCFLFSCSLQMQKFLNRLLSFMYYVDQGTCVALLGAASVTKRKLWYGGKKYKRWWH